MRDVSRAAETQQADAADTQQAKYEILRPLATGGMAEVYLARARDTGRLLVLKKLHPRLAIEPEYVQMFTDEAVIASKLQHPNLVEIYELGLDGEEHYIAMEYLYGHDLSRLLRKMKQQRIPLMFQQAITIVRAIAGGLHYAHERVGDDGNLLNIIHRDVSPHNVILTYAGEVKVVDFGIAKANSQVARTRTGVLKGKAAYMSPEQALGEPVDRRTDVFSMGIVLWELTAGRWLYRRKSELETLKAVVETDAPRPSTIRSDYPKDLEKIVMKALARSPDKRWSTAGELRSALDDLARGWRFQPNASLVSKLMATVFADEVAAWDTARAAGISLADHLVAAQREVIDWDDPVGTDPEESFSLETRRAPLETKERVEPKGGPPPAHAATAPAPPAQPWWWRHRRALVVSLIAGVLVGIIAGVIALVSSSGSPRAPVPAPTSPGVTPPTIETLDLTPAPSAATPPVNPAPPRPPAPAPSASPDTKVPIVYPPALPDAKKKKGRSSASDGSTESAP